ncbi:esterase-like activity of phytase family protein [Flavobacterium lacustre]|uniref:esterase-like activity of phytase family protein n=1 Tax=Flavobacterium lacustre TaxID=3016339 RepID=UPI0022B6AFC2|nr:esterase-like activity of phytase family protein [Flavobacterium lacustre]
MRKFLLLVVLQIVFLSCSNLKQTNENQRIPSLKLISSLEIPYDELFQNTKIGGLSGIDYNAKQDLYYLISDDRSVFNDSRFYTAKIHLVENKLKSIDFQTVTTLKNETGKEYGNWNTSPNTSTDPEDIRFNPKNNSLIWSSEGARVLSADKLVLQNPAINFMDLNGVFLNTVTVPENLKMQKQGAGPRNNGTLEGITFDKKYKTIYTNIEEPLIEDDNSATTEKGGLVRFYKFNEKTKKNTAQYAYSLEPIAHEANPKNAFAVNGISAIQYYKKNQLLVVERSYSTGTQACTIKIFLCNLKKATNIKKYASLKNKQFKIASKKLVLNMDDLGIFIDNIEGLTFGPKLSNGNQSLLFVSDNNFSDKQKTQLLVFELVN